LKARKDPGDHQGRKVSFKKTTSAKKKKKGVSYKERCRSKSEWGGRRSTKEKGGEKSGFKREDG